MKKLLLLLILAFVSLTGNAQFPIGVGKIGVGTKGFTTPALTGMASRVVQHTSPVEKALAEEVLRPPEKRDWAYFLEQNRQLQQKTKTEVNEGIDAICHLYDTDCALLSKLLGQDFWGKFRPDYAQETEGVKYIYVSDASDHDTKTIPLEVIRLMRAVRQANPDARILLATEFAVDKWEDRSLPLRFAHSEKMPFEIGPSYEPLLLAGDQNDIDILGLDDNGRAMDDQTIKIGDVSIEISLEDPQIQRILTQYDPEAEQMYEAYLDNKELLNQYSNSLVFCIQSPQEAIRQLNISPDKLPQYMASYEHAVMQCTEYTESVLVYFHTLLLDFLSRSDWGVAQRNDQWTRYIKAVSPYYDIIITYAGSGHLDDALSVVTSVPALIGKKYALFNFYTEEQLPEELKQGYERAEQIQQQEQTSDNPFSGVNIREDMANGLTQLMTPQYRTPPQGQESSDYFFTEHKYTIPSDSDLRDLAAELGVQLSELDLDENYSYTEFDVYLPENL